MFDRRFNRDDIAMNVESHIVAGNSALKARAAWALSVATLFYSAELFVFWRFTREPLVEDSARTASVVAPTDGISFDLTHLSVLHLGPVGWVGGIAVLFAMVWLASNATAAVTRAAKEQPRGGMRPTFMLGAAVLQAIMAEAVFTPLLNTSIAPSVTFGIAPAILFGLSK